MKVLIIGAHGKIGKIISGKMSKEQFFTPTAFIRSKEQVTVFNEMEVATVVASLEDNVANLTKLLAGYDAVVFTAGSGGKTGADKTLEIDLDGAVKTMIAAENAGVKRFVMVSAAYADDRAFWDKSNLKPYYIAKHFADLYLKNSGLDFTIVRPVTLTDENGVGTITVAGAHKPLQKDITREDVASTVLEVLMHNKALKQVIEISCGTIPIAEAVV